MNKLKVSANKRYLEYTDGTPFFWLGDTAWELFHRLDRAEVAIYLDNRAKKGFSVLQAVVLAELDGLDTPNAYGHTPLHDNDPTRPNEAYFEHVDFVVAEAEKRGLFIAMLPTWGKYVVEMGKWSQPIFTPESARTYGEYLGSRYKDKPIIWVLGGDVFTSTDRDRAIFSAMADGLGAGDDGAHLKTYHPRGPGRSSEDWHEAEWLDFNMSQTSHAAPSHDSGLSAASDYAKEPIKPTLDGEPRYEGIPVGFYNAGARPMDRFDDYDARTAAYWSIFSGACGHTYGHNSVWQMWLPGRNPIISANTPWTDAIDHPGAFQMGHLARLFRSRAWQKLRPDRGMVLGAPLTGPSLVRGLRADDGSFGFLYSSQGEPFTIDLTTFDTPQLTGKWFDPRYGVIYPIHTGSARGFQTFIPPTAGRGQDWVLLLEDPRLGFPDELFDAPKKDLPPDTTERPAEW